MAKDVKIIINMVKPIGSVGFGCPLILEENATTAHEYAEYTNSADILTAGYLADSDVYKAAQLMFMQPHAPARIAICSTDGTAEAWLAVEANLRKDWRQLVVANESETATNIAGIMSIIEAQTTYLKIYYANVAYEDDTEYTTAGIDRTVLCYYTPTEEVPIPVAALAGEVGGCPVGSYTLNNMVVNGIPGYELSEVEADAIHAKGGITFVVAAGDVVASEGHAVGGEFVDNTDNNDFIRQQLEYNIQKVKNNALKLPYTDEGISRLEAAALAVMQDAVSKNIIASANDYTVNFAKRADTTEADRAARQYFGGQLSWKLAGAIHETTITCEVSV